MPRYPNCLCCNTAPGCTIPPLPPILRATTQDAEDCECITGFTQLVPRTLGSGASWIVTVFAPNPCGSRRNAQWVLICQGTGCSSWIFRVNFPGISCRSLGIIQPGCSLSPFYLRFLVPTPPFCSFHPRFCGNETGSYYITFTVDP